MVNNMSEYLLLLVGAILVNNFVLVQFLGLCPFMGTSKKLETAIGLSLATTFVLTLSSIFSYATHALILEPFNLCYLNTLSFILVIAVTVQFTEMVVKKASPMLYRVLGVYLPLITVNCAVLGLALLNISKDHSFLQSLIYGFGGGAGFSNFADAFGDIFGDVFGDIFGGGGRRGRSTVFRGAVWGIARIGRFRSARFYWLALI